MILSMPRSKQMEDLYKNKDLTEIIRRYKYGKGLSNAEVGKLIGVAERTFAKYLEQPDTMTLKTLRTIQKRLQIPKDEFISALL